MAQHPTLSYLSVRACGRLDGVKGKMQPASATRAYVVMFASRYVTRPSGWYSDSDDSSDLIGSEPADVKHRSEVVEQVSHLTASSGQPSISHKRSQIFAAASVKCMTGTQRGPYPTATSGRFWLERVKSPVTTLQMLALNWAFALAPAAFLERTVDFRHRDLRMEGGQQDHAS
jgi:hypothetical protein